jgi:hypothetical protein
MNARQRTVIVGGLGAGLTVAEAADLARIPQPTLRTYWSKGETDRLASRESEEASFVSDALHARAKHIAELKLQANESAGTKEASDRLAMIRRLAEERLPEAEEGQITSAPRLITSSDPEVSRLAKQMNDAAIDLLEALAGAHA